MRWVVLAWLGLLGAGCTPGDTDTDTGWEDTDPWTWEDTAVEASLSTRPCGHGVAAMIDDRAYPTIAAALADRHAHSNVLKICPGVHTEPLVLPEMDWPDSGIDYIDSWSWDPSDTILDGEGEHRILYAEKTVILGGLTLRNGVADRGGAIYGTEWVGVYHSVLQGNTAAEDGGAIYAKWNASCWDCVVESNLAEGRGGAIFAEGGVDAQLSTFTENSASEGGAVYATKNTLSLDQSTFEANHAALRGGAAVVAEGEEAIVEGSLFQGNTSEQDAGALFLGAEEVRVLRSDLHANTSEADAGALAMEAETALIQGSHLEDNRAGGSGGALLLARGTSATLRDCVFLDNGAALGGAVGVREAALTLRSTTLEGNRADQGGALHLSGSELTVTQSSLVSNTATSQGAALYLMTEDPLPQVRLWTSEISDHNAEEGALYLAGPVDLLVDESRVLGNTDTLGAVVLDGTLGQALSSIASDWGVGEEDNLPADVAGLERALGQDETFVCVQGTEGLECD